MQEGGVGGLTMKAGGGMGGRISVVHCLIMIMAVTSFIVMMIMTTTVIFDDGDDDVDDDGNSRSDFEAMRLIFNANSTMMLISTRR